MFRFNSAFVIYRNTVAISELNYTKCFWIRDMIIFLLFAQELAAAPPRCFPATFRSENSTIALENAPAESGRTWKRCRVTAWNKFADRVTVVRQRLQTFLTAADGTEGNSKK